MQGNVAGRFAKIAPRRRIDAKGTRAQVNPIDVQRENLFLSEIRLEPESKKQFLHLAPERSVRLQKDVLGKLLGERASALANASGPDIGNDGAHQSDGIEPEMAKKAPVFCRHDSLHQIWRYVSEAQRVAIDIAIGCDFAAVGIRQRDASFTGRYVELVDIREIICIPRDHDTEGDRPPDSGDNRPFQGSQKEAGSSRPFGLFAWFRSVTRCWFAGTGLFRATAFAAPSGGRHSAAPDGFKCGLSCRGAGGLLHRFLGSAFRQ